MSSKRKTWMYRGCRIEPIDGPSRYFGNADYPANPIQYRSLYWRVNFPDQTWCYCGTKEDSREYVGRVGYRHGVTELPIQARAA